MLHPLALRTADLEATLSFERFAGLPREEVERLEGSIELLALDEAAVRAGQQLPIFLLVAMHHNYRWLVHTRPLRSLHVTAPLLAGAAPQLGFLDAGMAQAACDLVDGLVPARRDYDLRCAGLVRGPEAAGLAVLYLARLNRRVEDCLAPGLAQIALAGNGDLLLERAEFNATSRVLIDHLAAL